MTELQLPSRGKNRSVELEIFAETLQKIDRQIGFKVSARGWCYQLEQFGLITKAEFNKVENVINECRKIGLLVVDFTAEEEGRKFSCVDRPEEATPIEYMKRYLKATLDCGEWYTPDWWVGEEYYIQMIVEKIDLKTLFEPICEQYHIPIATSKGWSSMLQRAEYARRFKEAEEKGLKCILLYCGDHDPDGLRISDFLRSNLEDLANIEWEDGTEGYDPINLEIIRFGLDYDFIVENKLSWIENLITGSGKNLGSPSHKNFHMKYLQDYIKKYGKRKCEANALVVRPEQGRELCKDTIIEYLGEDALRRFQRKRNKILKQLEDFREKTKLDATIKKAIKIIDKEKGDEEF